MKKEKKYVQAAIDFKTSVLGKVPPQSKDLEEAVLGAKMLEKSAFDTVATIVKSEGFYVDDHPAIPSQTKGSSKVKAATAAPNEAVSLKFGLFALQATNPGKKTLLILLLGMGFILILVTLVFVLRHYL